MDIPDTISDVHNAIDDIQLLWIVYTHNHYRYP